MAISNFISTVWSESLLKSLDQQYVAVANCNRDYDGDIKEKGSIVKICGVGTVGVMNYTPNTDISTSELSDTCVELHINQAKYFNFQIDDVDRAQSSPKLMDAAMRLAAAKLAEEADKYVYSLHNYTENWSTLDEVTPENIIDAIITAREKIFKKSGATDLVLEISPAIASILIKAKLDICDNNRETLETGCIGSVLGSKVFVSNNIAIAPDGDITYHKCLLRSKRAIAFAEQISEVMAYRPEKRFADAVKGLHLYGAEIVYPDELCVLDLGVRVK